MKFTALALTGIVSLATAVPAALSLPVNDVEPAAAGPAHLPPLTVKRGECKYKTPCHPQCAKEQRHLDECSTCLQSCGTYYQLQKSRDICCAQYTKRETTATSYDDGSEDALHD